MLFINTTYTLSLEYFLFIGLLKKFLFLIYFKMNYDKCHMSNCCINIYYFLFYFSVFGKLKPF